jgi:hypothetical protein
MKTDRFKEIREGVLRDVFDKKILTDNWRRIVKNQLRGLDLKDIYDYYDFNYNIESRSTALRSEVLSGAYKTEVPLVYKVEKKLGICRHLMIPQPSDALIMQTISESLYLKIEKGQPSDNAFYSRDRHNVNLPHGVSSDAEYEKNWLKLWGKMQKKIYHFKESKELIAVTDLTNYFDSIDLSTLRESMLSLVDKNDEVLIDLLFRVIEGVSWKPDYLPYKRHGLPTINIEAIRLLGHAFLFEVDEVLKKKTGENFTRWMDDITIGVDTKKDAVLILGGISDVLKSRGLALNLSKTNLYCPEEFSYHYLIDSNLYLDSFTNVDNLSNEQKKEFKKKFKLHLKDRMPKNWDKITKRFLTLLSKFRIDISCELKELYLNNPSVRASVARYFSSSGYSKAHAKNLIDILTTLDIRDDISLFYLCQVFTSWNIPIDNDASNFIKQFYNSISRIDDPFQFYCLIWIKAKYDHPEDLLNFIDKYKNNWQKTVFLRRQVTGILSRLYLYDKERVRKLLNEQLQTGIMDVVSLSNQIEMFTGIENLDTKLKFYIFPNKLKHYSLERFLVLCSVLNSEEIRKNKDVQDKIKDLFEDSYFKKWLDITYNIRK